MSRTLKDDFMMSMTKKENELISQPVKIKDYRTKINHSKDGISNMQLTMLRAVIIKKEEKEKQLDAACKKRQREREKDTAKHNPWKFDEDERK
jgi:hypothetical protein